MKKLKIGDVVKVEWIDAMTSILKVKLRIAILVFALIIISMGDLYGADWKLYSFSDNVGHNYYDAQSITRPSKNIVRVWERTNYTEKGVMDWVGKFGEKFANLSYSISLEETNCAEKTYRFLSGHYYDNSGKLILSDSSPTEWLSIVPGSIAEGLYEEICK